MNWSANYAESLVWLFPSGDNSAKTMSGSGVPFIYQTYIGDTYDLGK